MGSQTNGNPDTFGLEIPGGIAMNVVDDHIQSKQLLRTESDVNMKELLAKICYDDDEHTQYLADTFTKSTGFESSNDVIGISNNVNIQDREQYKPIDSNVMPSD